MALLSSSSSYVHQVLLSSKWRKGAHCHCEGASKRQSFRRQALSVLVVVVMLMLKVVVVVAAVVAAIAGASHFWGTLRLKSPQCSSA